MIRLGYERTGLGKGLTAERVDRFMSDQLLDGTGSDIPKVGISSYRCAT